MKPSRNKAEYQAWYMAKRRCYNTLDARYSKYGARGIGMCARWADSASGFDNFMSDMGPRPEGMHGRRALYSLDRIDNDKDYSPENCRWSTIHEQARNKSSSVFVTIDGEVMGLRAACGYIGRDDYKLVWQRINREGWSVEKALYTSSDGRSLRWHDDTDM